MSNFSISTAPDDFWIQVLYEIYIRMAFEGAICMFNFDIW